MSTSGAAPMLSVARVLDNARFQIIDAWDRDERPTYLLCSPALFEVVADAKRRETQAGRGLRLLGLLVVSSAELSGDEVRVR